MDTNVLADFLFRAQIFAMVAVVLAITLGIMAGIGVLVLLWFRFKDREESSLGYVLLQVAVPRQNEVKIDAAEQMFASFASLYKSHWFPPFNWFKPQTHFCFEIVAKMGDIRFYV